MTWPADPDQCRFCGERAGAHWHDCESATEGSCRCDACKPCKTCEGRGTVWVTTGSGIEGAIGSRTDSRPCPDCNNRYEQVAEVLRRTFPLGEDSIEATLPRRICIDKFTPAERAIYDAIQTIEAMPADARLTKALMLLGQAQSAVADFVDGISK